MEVQEWTLDLYRGHIGHDEDKREPGDNDGTLELDLEEEEAVLASKCVTIAVYNSRKSYNPHVLFAYRMGAWNISKLAKVKKISDYIFKIKFMSHEGEG
jgi:hypothetical protein